MHDMLAARRRRPTSCSAPRIGAVILSVAKEIGLAGRADRRRLRVAGVVVNVAQVGFRTTPGAVKPEFKRLNPVSGFKQIFGPNALVEGENRRRRSSSSASIVASPRCSRHPRDGRARGHAARRSSAPSSPSTVLRHRQTRRVRLSPDRRGRLLLAALPATRSRCAWTSRRSRRRARGSTLPAEVRCAQRRRHAMRGRRMMDAVPEGRRHRHQPDALLRRPEVRRRHARADGRGQGPGPHRAPKIREIATRARRADRARPAAGARACTPPSRSASRSPRSSSTPWRRSWRSSTASPAQERRRMTGA